MDELTAEASRAEALPLTAGYHLVDYLTCGYILLVAVLVLLFHGETVPHWPLFVVAHLAVLPPIHVLIRAAHQRPTPLLRMLRAFYPMILYTFLYTEVHHLDGMFYPGVLDGFFIDLDQLIFGFQPSRTLMANLPYLWVSELFYAAYFSYYLMVLTVGMALYFRRPGRFACYITVVSFVFYLCYLTYIALPVMGPHGTHAGVIFSGRLASVGPRAVPASLTRGPFYRLMAVLYRLVEPQGGAAFPSSHVTVAVATLWFTWRYLGGWRWLHLLAVIMLCISTVYCGYHYAVDVFGGLAAAAVLVPLGQWMHRRWGGPLGVERAPG